MEAWETVEGAGIVIAIVDDGVDIDHEEFAARRQAVAPHSFSRPVGDDPRPSEGDNHGTACAGVACADGVARAPAASPRARA